MRHGGASGGFNIFSTNGVLPRCGERTPSGPPTMAQGRGDHARLLAYAAKRRLAAQSSSPDRAYWRAGAPVALQKAIAIRRDQGLAKLP
jgi:hypothetical protein